MMQVWDKLRILRSLVHGAVQTWRKEVWPHDLDTRFCCDGRECGCGGSTFRDVYLWRPET